MACLYTETMYTNVLSTIKTNNLECMSHTSEKKNKTVNFPTKTDARRHKKPNKHNIKQQNQLILNRKKIDTVIHIGLLYSGKFSRIAIFADMEF